MTKKERLESGLFILQFREAMNNEALKWFHNYDELYKIDNSVVLSEFCTLNDFRGFEAFLFASEVKAIELNNNSIIKKWEQYEKFKFILKDWSVEGFEVITHK